MSGDDGSRLIACRLFYERVSWHHSLDRSGSPVSIVASAFSYVFLELGARLGASPRAVVTLQHAQRFATDGLRHLKHEAPDPQRYHHITQVYEQPSSMRACIEPAACPMTRRMNGPFTPMGSSVCVRRSSSCSQVPMCDTDFLLTRQSLELKSYSTCPRGE